MPSVGWCPDPAKVEYLRTTGVHSISTRALHNYQIHYHPERNHQGKGNVLLFPTTRQTKIRVGGSVRCKERLGGLLKYYHLEAT